MGVSEDEDRTLICRIGRDSEEKVDRIDTDSFSSRNGIFKTIASKTIVYG